MGLGGPQIFTDTQHLVHPIVQVLSLRPLHRFVLDRKNGFPSPKDEEVP